MSQNLFQRSLSLGLAAFLTFGALGAVDHLAQPDPAQGLLARAASSLQIVQADRNVRNAWNAASTQRG